MIPFCEKHSLLGNVYIERAENVISGVVKHKECFCNRFNASQYFLIILLSVVEFCVFLVCMCMSRCMRRSGGRYNVHISRLNCLCKCI